MATMAARTTAWACELDRRETVKDEYRPFPDVARRNAWQERCEAPALVPARHALLWASRVKAAASAFVLAAVLTIGVAPARAEDPPPVASLARAEEPALPAAPAPTAPPPAPEPAAAAGEPEMGTRLFFAPTARSLPHGTGSVGLTEIAFPGFEAALGDRVSVLGVVPPLKGLTGAGLVLAPKVQLVRRERFQAAAGVMHAFGAGDAGGVAYGVVTVGNTRTGATLGVGYGYGGWVDDTGSRAIVFVGLDHRLARSFRLVLEGWIGRGALGLPDTTLIGALRVGRRWSVDLGVVVPVYETGSGTPFPLITIARRF